MHWRVAKLARKAGVGQPQSEFGQAQVRQSASGNPQESSPGQARQPRQADSGAPYMREANRPENNHGSEPPAQNTKNDFSHARTSCKPDQPDEPDRARESAPFDGQAQGFEPDHPLPEADPGSWSADDWRAFFDERARFAEVEGRLARTDAESRAYACCVGEWLIQHPVRSEPGRCLSCGGAENGYDALLPFGTESSGHAWLHGRCWDAWYARRKAEAVAALAAMGIEIRSIDQCREKRHKLLEG
jgi:hypothetical protein